MKEIKINNNKFLIDESSLPKKHKNFWERVNTQKWEPEIFEILKESLSENSIYLDIGSWIGPTILYAATICKNIYAIEPDPVAFKYLEKNISLNPKLKSRIKLSRKCISDKNGYEKFGCFNEFGQSTSGLTFKNNKPIKIKSQKLETFLKENKLRKLDLIKLDIEGGETIVLPNISKFLKKEKPKLFLELHPFFFKNTKEDVEKISNSLTGYNKIMDIEKNKNIQLSKLNNYILKNKDRVIRLILT